MNESEWISRWGGCSKRVGHERRWAENRWLDRIGHNGKLRIGLGRFEIKRDRSIGKIGLIKSDIKEDIKSIKAFISFVSITIAKK